MASRCLLNSGSLLSRLSQLAVSSTREPVRANVGKLVLTYQNSTVRFFSDKGDGKEGGSPTKDKGLDSADEDPFGVHFEDGAERLGPEKSLPPVYKRDAATGRMTGEIKQELTEEEKRILKADPLEQEQLLLRRLEKHWEKEGVDESGQPAELDRLGERVRRSDMGLNVLGRSVRAQSEKLDGDELGRDESGFSKHLTKSEFGSFSAFMEKTHKASVDEDDIPVSDGKPHKPSKDLEDPETADLSLKWLTARAQRQMDDSLDDDPYSDLMPGDLSPPRLVNRKRAKRIPPKLLHHNNIPFLQRYLTPTGQIKYVAFVIPSLRHVLSFLTLWLLFNQPYRSDPQE
jgi:hypothetical protein